MIPYYSLILWAKPKQEEFKVTVDKTYALLASLKQFGPELSPNYLPAWKKKDTKIYDLTYQSLEELIKNKAIKEGKLIFKDLGYSLQFFSSLVDDESAGISLSIGVNNPKFSNTFNLDLPLTMDIFNEEISLRLIGLFKKCVKLFDPYWGCILNSFTLRRLEHLYVNNVPTTVHWVNYWGNDLVNKITEDRIMMSSLFLKEKIDDKGMLLILKKKPIDESNEEDIKIQKIVSRELGLKD
jgi:hypothetical protein